MMKSRRFLPLMLALVMLFSFAVTGCGSSGGQSAPASGAQNSGTAASGSGAPEVTPAMNYTSPNGQAYCWQPAGIYLTANADRVLLDYYTYMLKTPLQTKDDLIYISLDDLKTIYSPDFEVQIDGDAITMTHAGVSASIQAGSTAATFYTGAGELAGAPYRDGDTVFVPVVDLLTKGFGKTFSENGIYVGLGNSADFEVTNADVYNLKMFFRGKEMGKSYWAYWNDEVQRLQNVIVYVPTTYDASVPNKLIVQLHGAGGSAGSIPDGDNGPAMMDYAEKYGYIVAWPGDYARLCNWGMWVQPAGQLPITEDTDPANPAGHSPEKLADIKLSGSNLQKSIDFVESQWNINSKNVFLMGISMGGCGTWFQASTLGYADRFAACSPSGAFVEPAYFDWSTVTTPTYYVGGTEDRNGFDLMLNAYDIAISQGANIVKFDVVGGAPHGGEWPQRLTEVYEFFESYCS